jgi:hypothetical protein
MNVAFHKLATRHVKRLAPERVIHECYCHDRRAGLCFISKPYTDVVPCLNKAQRRFFSLGRDWQHIQKKYDILLEDSKSKKKYPPGHFSLRVKQFLLEMMDQPQQHDRMGPMAEHLLKAAEQDLIQSKSMRDREELRARLYKLVSE